MRPPRRLQSPFEEDGFASLEHEILAEKAATLARLGHRLDQALRELDAHGAPGAGRDEAWRERREELVVAAAEALWYFVVQREVCGLPDSDALMDQLRVPREVRLRMGLPAASRPRAPGSTGRHERPR